MSKIAVVGCGPAGLAFALAMKDAGADIVILERFTTAKAVGAGFILQPSGLAAAELLGIRADIEANGQPIRQVLGHTTDNTLVIDIDYRTLAQGQHAIALHRSTLIDELLMRVTQSGVPIVTGVDVRRFDRHSDGLIRLHSVNNDCLGAFDLVVDSSGSRSALRTQVFGELASHKFKYGSLWGTFQSPADVFPCNTLVQRFAANNASIGVMPIGSAKPGGAQQVAFFWNIECARYEDWRASGLPAWTKTVTRIWPECADLMEQVTDPEQLTLAEYWHHRNFAAPQPGIVFIGDAAHATSPQLGQGVNLSLLDAVVLARALGSDSNIAAACRLYAKQRLWHVQIVQFMTRMLVPFYQSDNGIAIAARDLLFQPVSRLPYMRHLMAAVVAGANYAPGIGIRAQIGM